MYSEITLKVQNSATFVEGKLESAVYKEFKKTLGYKDPNAIWKSKGSYHWDGIVSTVCYNRHYCKCAIKKDGVHFPTGLFSKAVEFFKTNNIPLKFFDQRLATPKTHDFQLSSNFEMRDYQIEVRDSAVPANNIGGRGIVKMATGSGKTKTIAAIIAKAGVVPVLFYVTSLDLLNQAKEEIETTLCLNNAPIKVGSIGNSVCDIQDITVITVQTAVRALGEKYEKYDDEENEVEDKGLIDKYEIIRNLIQSAKFIAADEVQHWASKTCQIISDHSENARYKFGLSGTPFRDLGDDLLIDSCFGKVIADINSSFLIKRGFLVKPTIYFIKTSTNLDGSYQTVYRSGIVENNERNLMIAKMAQKLIESGRQILILVRMIEHGDMLESMIPNSFFIHGQHTGKQRHEWLDKMRRREAPITIATSIFDEGVDVRPLDGLILAGSGKSKTRALQRIGRVIRPFDDPVTGFTKKDAIVVDFFDNTRYLKDHSRARKKIYQTESEFEIKMIDG